MSTTLESPAYSPLLPIAAPDAVTGERWYQQRTRREQIDGTWRQQLIDRAVAVVGAQRITGWGVPSLARALAESVCRELSVLYDEEWRWAHDAPASADYLNTTAHFAGLQAHQQRMQAYATGIGTCYMRVRGIAPAVPGGLPTVRYEVVPCDLVYDEMRDDGSDQPALVRHYSVRMVDGRPTWTADEWSIRDNGSYRLLVGAGSGMSEDESARLVGDAYPYRRADGRPILPYVLYHDGPARIGLHDPYHREALFAGSLDVAVLYWMATHSYRDASWPQRAVMGMRPMGGESSTDDAGNTVIRYTMDPSVLAMFEPLPDVQGQPLQWQWQPGADTEMMFRVLDDLAARIAVEAGGVTPTDLHRAAPNRSGSAIALTNEGKRRMQARATPSFRPGDERLASVTATVIRSLGGPQLAEDGYRVIYGSTPLSIDEQDARRRHAIEALNAHLMTRLEAYRYIHPEMSETDARAALAEMDPPAPPTPRQRPTQPAEEPDDERHATD